LCVLVVSTSQPFATSPSQSARPPLHAPTAHAPWEQIAVAFGTEHGLHDVAPQPKRGSSFETHPPEQSWRSEAH
jgi:hypothetical protein